MHGDLKFPERGNFWRELREIEVSRYILGLLQLEIFGY